MIRSCRTRCPTWNNLISWEHYWFYRVWKQPTWLIRQLMFWNQLSCQGCQRGGRRNEVKEGRFPWAILILSSLKWSWFLQKCIKGNLRLKTFMANWEKIILKTCCVCLLQSSVGLKLGSLWVYRYCCRGWRCVLNLFLSNNHLILHETTSGWCESCWLTFFFCVIFIGILSLYGSF
jgi:hypothetical protein